MTNNSDDNSYYELWKTNKLQSLNYNRAICLLASGHDIKEISKYLGVSVRTIQRWYQQSDFKVNMKRAVELTLTAALANASCYANRAIDLLKDMAEDVNCPYKYRLQAIRLIFQFSNRAIPDDSDINPATDYMEKLRTFAQAKDLLAVSRQFELPVLTPTKAVENVEVWEQIFPEEPYPDEENLKKFFDDTH
jgi:uncharacterized protein (UPF0147 family)